MSLFGPLWMHHQNESMAMERAASAKARGLDMSTYGTPLPGSKSESTTTINNTGGGFLRGALVTALTLATGAGGAVGLMKALAPAVVPTLEKVSPKAAQLYDAVIEEQQPDGSWKQIERKHLTP